MQPLAQDSRKLLDRQAEYVLAQEFQDKFSACRMLQSKQRLAFEAVAKQLAPKPWQLQNRRGQLLGPGPAAVRAIIGNREELVSVGPVQPLLAGVRLSLHAFINRLADQSSKN